MSIHQKCPRLYTLQRLNSILVSRRKSENAKRLNWKFRGVIRDVFCTCDDATSHGLEVMRIENTAQHKRVIGQYLLDNKFCTICKQLKPVCRRSLQKVVFY